MKFFLTLALILTTVLAYSQTKEKTLGEIKGTVTDANGNLVPGATVYVVPQEISFENIAPRSITSNALGEFDFGGGFALGTYKLYAKKESDGYPDPSDTFYADPKREPLTVELTKDHPSSATTVALLDRAAVLAGRVVDANSGVPLKAKLVFMDQDGNSHSVMVTGKYRALVPPGKDLTLMVMVTSPDYGSQAPVPPLRLVSGQEMDMDIPLSKR
jgi:Carboxypeptidase regulatory-like domain